MSSIDSSNTSLNSILDKLGIQKPADQTAPSDKLGQADFLKLMTTQLQNQDPFAPMENGDFIAQMAQFSTVTGITEISESLKSLSGQLSEFRIATAANMLGHSVLVPGSNAYPDSDGVVSGAVDIPSASANTNILYRSANGEILHTQDLGPQAAGLVGFRWEDIPQAVLDANEYIKIEAYADTGTGLQSVGASVYSEVLAASTGKAAVDVVYDVRGYGDVKASDVVQFKK
jgi:flagellar basal-body rod modification protein FlgD